MDSRLSNIAGLGALLSGDLAIDQEWGFAQLNAFAIEMAMAANGVPASELGISERRHAQLPTLYSADGQELRRGVEGWQIYNESDTPQESVALIPLNGVMRATSAASTRGTDMIERDLRAAYNNRNISAIVMDINSGGGEAIAGFRLASAIGERNKPIISLGHFVGSAAYMAAAATDEVHAGNMGAKFGSIGALYQISRNALESYAKDVIEIYADQSTDKNAAHRAAKEGDFSLLKIEATKMAQSFIDLVQSNREIPDKYTQKAFAGGMFDAREARRMGLIDFANSNLNTAIARAMYWAKRKKNKK